MRRTAAVIVLLSGEVRAVDSGPATGELAAKRREEVYSTAPKGLWAMAIPCPEEFLRSLTSCLVVARESSELLIGSAKKR